MIDAIVFRVPPCYQVWGAACVCYHRSVSVFLGSVSQGSGVREQGSGPHTRPFIGFELVRRELFLRVALASRIGRHWDLTPGP